MSLEDQIREVDGRLLVAGERLARYRNKGLATSVIVQRGVCDRSATSASPSWPSGPRPRPEVPDD